MSDQLEIKPNAFAFKAFVDDEYRMCICPRISGSWSENDIFYVKDPVKEVYDSLDNNLFNVIFVVYEKDENGGFWIKSPTNPYYLKSDTMIAIDLYANGEFFKMIEKGYQLFYEKTPDVLPNQENQETKDS